MQGPVAIILAAGQGKRMKSEKAKVLHEVCGRPMIRYVVDAARGAGAKTIIVVVGYAADQVRQCFQGEPDILFATQTEQLGTGHAVKVCRPLLAGYEGPALVLVGDEPLLGPSRWPTCSSASRSTRPPACWAPPSWTTPWVSAGSFATRPAVFSASSKNATARPKNAPSRRSTRAAMSSNCPELWDALDQIGTSNAQGEYYLTDAPEHLMTMGTKVVALNVLRADDVLGVNTRQHLALAGAIMQTRIQDHWMTEGVTIVDPRNTYIDGRASIGADTIIYPFTVITGTVKVGSGCRIGPHTHLRDGTVLDDGVEVGAFVEIKQSHVGAGTIVRHLAYLGDADVGEAANIGATVVTANFDGVQEHQTQHRRPRPAWGRRHPDRTRHDRRRRGRRGQRRRHPQPECRRRPNRRRRACTADRRENLGNGASAFAPPTLETRQWIRSISARSSPC